MAKISRVTAISLVFAVLAALVAVAQHPYVVYASLASSCTISTTAPVAGHIASVTSPDTEIKAGSNYRITVTADQFTTHFQDVELGVVISVTPGTTGNQLQGKIIVDRVMAPGSQQADTSSSLSAAVKWQAPNLLYAGLYTFTPLILGDGEVLSQSATTPQTLPSSTQAPGVFLTGAYPTRVELATGSTPSPTSTAQELVQYKIANTTSTNQEAVIRWRLYTSAMNGVALAKDDITYTQELAPGNDLSRQYFLDTTKVGDAAYLEVDVTSGASHTIQDLPVNGKNPLSMTVKSIDTSSRGVSKARVNRASVCFSSQKTLPKNTIVTVVVKDNDQVQIAKKVFEAGDTVTGQYDVRDYSLSTASPLTVTVEEQVAGKVIYRTIRNI